MPMGPLSIRPLSLTIDKFERRIPFDNFCSPFDRNPVKTDFVFNQCPLLHSDRRRSQDLKVKPLRSNRIQVKRVAKKRKNSLRRMRKPQFGPELVNLNTDRNRQLYAKQVQNKRKKQTEQNAGC